MNGPPPAKRHSISTLPSGFTPQQIAQQQQPLNQLSALPFLQTPGFHPQLMAAAVQAHVQAQQQLNGMAKPGQGTSILALPTVPPAFIGTTPRIGGVEQHPIANQIGLTLSPQMIGLPEGLSIQQLQQLLLQSAATGHPSQTQVRMNGHPSSGLPSAPPHTIPQAQIPTQAQSHAAFLQHLQQLQQSQLAQNQLAQLQQSQNQLQQKAMAAAANGVQPNFQAAQLAFIQQQKQQQVCF